MNVEPPTKSEGPPEKLQKMQIPFRSVEETNKMFHAGALTPSPEELQEMHFPVRSVEETNKKLFHVRPPTPSPEELQIPVKSVEGAKKMFYDDFKSGEGAKKMFHDSSRDSSPFNSPESSPEKLQTKQIPFHIEPLKALDVEKDSKNEDTNPLVEISTIARWTSDEIEKLMDDNSWAFSTRQGLLYRWTEHSADFF